MPGLHPRRLALSRPLADAGRGRDRRHEQKNNHSGSKSTHLLVPICPHLSWHRNRSRRRSAGQELHNAEPTALRSTPSPRVLDGDEGEKQGIEHEIIYTHLLRRCKSRAAATGGRGGRAGSVARRPHGGGRPRRRENTMKSEEQSRGQAKGFFHRQGGAFDSTFYVQGTNLVRRVALDCFSTSACRTRWTYPTRSTGPVGHLLYVRGPAGR